MALAILNEIDYPKTIIFNNLHYKDITFSTLESRSIVVSEMLPFRVRFTNIGIEDQVYGPGNPAPIGIAIVGYNNYIL